MLPMGGGAFPNMILPNLILSCPWDLSAKLAKIRHAHSQVWPAFCNFKVMKTATQQPATSALIGLNFRRIFLFMAFALAFTASAWTQNTGEAWEEEGDEEDEPTEEKALIDDRPEKKEEVTVTLNGEVFQWAEEVHIKKEDTLEISVRDLAPASRVEIIAEKGGINLSRKIFYSNNRGELDLEVRMGNKKIKGKAKLIYTPSGASKKEREVMIFVE
jgi:hypothetical protein